MIFENLSLKGSYLLKLEKHLDERGFFARTFCSKEFEEKGLNNKFLQSSISYNIKKGTLRGMHYQVAPHEEVKLVQCVKGAIYDVIIDLRTNSSTYCQWVGAELNEDNGNLVYVPKGFAHGFQTLTDETVVYYQISDFYAPESARGVRWDDPAFGINWPIDEPVISIKDSRLPDYKR